MRFNTKVTEKWITCEHSAFKDTDYYGEDMEFLITPVSRKEISRASDENTVVLRKGRIKTDDINVQRDLFVKCVKDWKNLHDEDGNALECNEKNKRLIADQFLTLTAAILESAMDESDRILSAKEEQKGN